MMPPSKPYNYELHKNVVATGCGVCHAKKSRKPHVSEERVEQARMSLVRSASKSTWRASCELDILLKTVWYSSSVV
jgi:hypothetical protein